MDELAKKFKSANWSELNESERVAVHVMVLAL
jgi:hypothetical protein